MSGWDEGTGPGPTDPEPTDPEPAGTAPLAPPARGLLAAGGLWGRWTLRRRIRTGGSAQVWRATDDEGERAAIKFLLRPDNEVEIRRFARERDLGERFRGKWLPRVLDSNLDDIAPWIAFEYLEFPALDQLVAASGPLTGEALVIFTRDLWDAVLSLHAHDVAHRDLSPRNVLIDVDDGRLRLIDLGSGAAGDGTLITQDVFPASLGFAAPEQFDVRESRVGPAADIWSWAAVVHYAATGTTVLPVDPALAYIDHLRRRTEPPLTGVPDALRPALAAALRHDPAERDRSEVTRLLPLRAHEAALRAAEERLAAADAETQALRAAVSEANQRLELRAAEAERMARLEQQAAQAAADAAEARRQLEEATAATRHETAVTAKVVEGGHAPLPPPTTPFPPPAPFSAPAPPPPAPRPRRSGGAWVIAALISAPVVLCGTLATAAAVRNTLAGSTTTTVVASADVRTSTTATRRVTTTRAPAGPTTTTTVTPGPEGTYTGTESDFSCSGDAECRGVTPSNGRYVIRGRASSATLDVPLVGTIPAIDPGDCAEGLDVDESDIGLCFAGRVDGADCRGQATSDLYLVTIPTQPWGRTIRGVAGRLMDNACGRGNIVGQLRLVRTE